MTEITKIFLGLRFLQSPDNASKLAGGYTSKRIGYIDALKGFAILCVVLGHIIDGYIDANLFSKYNQIMYAVHNLIYSFHMPLFFTLSGYIFYRAYCVNREQKFYKFKISILNNIYIYLLFSCLLWLTKTVFSASVNTKVSYADLLLIAVKPMYGPFWYLYVLVFYYLIFYFAMRSKLSDKVQLLCSLGLSMVGGLVLCCFHFGQWLSSEHFIVNFVFFSLGIYISKTEVTAFLSMKSFIITCIGTIISALSAIAFNINLLSVPIIGTITAGIMTIFIINVFVKFRPISNAKYLQLCGKYSFEIYTMHCFITAANRIFLIKLGITVFGINVVINFIMATFIPIFCAYVLKKIKIYHYVFKPFTVIGNRKGMKKT